MLRTFLISSMCCVHAGYLHLCTFAYCFFTTPPPLIRLSLFDVNSCMQTDAEPMWHSAPFKALVAFVKLVGQAVKVPLVALDLRNGDALDGILDEDPAKQVLDGR